MRGPDHISGDALGDPARPARSQRSRVAPFYVMQVLAAAARRPRRRRTWSGIWPRANHPRPHRRPCGGGARRVGRAHPRLHRGARHPRRCARPSPGTTATATVWTSTPTTWSSPPARRAASCWPSWPRSTSAAGSGWPGPATRPTGTSCTPWGVRSSTCRADRRPATSRRCRWSTDLGLDGLIVASPANPTGTMLEPGELAALATWCAGSGVRLISDEIYHGITYTGVTSSSWADRSARHRGELVLQVLLDDRVADRLAAGARRPRRRRGRAGRQPGHLPARAGAVRRGRRVRRLRRMRRPCAAGTRTTGGCC